MADFTPIPQEELDVMRAQEEAATKGPWEDTGDAISHEDWSKTEIIYHAGKGDNDCACFIGWKEEDRIFAAHARTDQPRLLDAYEALLADNKRLREALREARIDSLPIGPGTRGLIQKYKGGVPPHFVFQTVDDHNAPLNALLDEEGTEG